MPIVPYDPTPRIPGEGRPYPTLRAPSALGEAFGTGVARAREQLGGEVEQRGRAVEQLGEAFGGVGQKLAESAIAFQDLNNETWAKNADVDSMVKMGDATTKFDQLEGLNRINALPAYQEQIKGIREEGLANAPNPRAREMLDNLLARRVGYTLIDAGRSAATAAKEAAKKADELRQQYLVDNFSFDDSNKALIDLKAAKESNISNMEQQGVKDPEAVEDSNKIVQGKMILNGIKKELDPDKKRALFDKWGKLMPDAFRKAAEDDVKQREGQVSGEREADKLLSSGGKLDGREIPPFDPSKGPGQLQDYQQLGKQIEEQDRWKDNDTFRRSLDGRIENKIRAGVQGHDDTQKANVSWLEDFANKGDQKIQDMNAIYTNPDANSRFEQLDQKYKDAIEKYVNKPPAYVPYTDERKALFGELMKKATNQNDPAGIAEFKNMPLTDVDLPPEQKKIVQTMQRRLWLKQAPDIDISPVMHDAYLGGIINSTVGPPNSHRNNIFAGEVHQALEEWKLNNPGQTLTREVAIQEGKKLLRDVVVTTAGGGWFGQPSVERSKAWQIEVPSDWRRDLTNAWTSKFGTAPNEFQLRLQYLKELENLKQPGTTVQFEEGRAR